MQLDGDMVNRIALGPEHDGDLLYRVHNEMVNRSFRYWEMVAGLVASVIRGRPSARL